MIKLKNKIVTIVIAIFLMLSMSASIMLIPNASAHSPPQNIQLLAFVNVAPNPIGVDQKVTVDMWLNEPPPTANGPYGDRWTNYTVLVTKPDGTKQTLGPFTADDTGGTTTYFTPTVAGNYTFVFSFLGQTLAGNNPPPSGNMPGVNAFIGDYYEPATSSPAVLTVQQQPVSTLPNTPLPTSYWQTPVNAMNVNNWYTLNGNWLGFGGQHGGMYNMSGNYNPYTLAPAAAHILWTKPEAFGGALGGEFGGTETSNYYATSQYEPKFSPVIMNGILYYEQYTGSSTNPNGIVAVDLYTGQTLWTSDTTLESPSPTSTGDTVNTAGPCTTLLCGQTLDYVTPNQYGGLAYLWTVGTPAEVASATNIAAGSTTFNMFDAMTGDYILSIVNGTSMALTEDASGDLIGYYVNSTNPNAPTLNEWNSTQCIVVGTNGLASWAWRPTQGAILNFADGIMWSTPIATNISGVPLPSTLNIFNSGVLLLVSLSSGGSFLFQGGFIIEAGYSAVTGQQLWITNRTETPYTYVTLSEGYGFCDSLGSGVFVEINQDTMTLMGNSLNTGANLWTTSLAPFNPYDSDGVNCFVANGSLYIWGLGGDVWSVNMLTGVVNWHFSTGSAGANTPYGVWPIWTLTETGTAADGMLYLPEGHEYSPPLFHGAQQLCLNMTTGKLIWSIDAFDVEATAIADGIMTTRNCYDNQIYAYGMGPSATTVSAPQIGVTTSTPVTITGTVMDISAGSQQNAVAANFPNGLPCVSDASMSQWMEYVYMQQPMPTNTTGVPVTLSVIDSNGNNRPIGTTTTTSSGFYSLTWTPDIAGNYTVTATFAGTQSYYGSSAQTAFYASAPATTAPTASPVTGLATMSGLTIGFAAAVIAIIIAIAIAVLLITEVLRFLVLKLFLPFRT
jgi:hypothetical protein